MLIIREEMVGGIPYRITEDLEIGFFIKESLQEAEPVVLPPTSEQLEIIQLQAENAALKSRIADIEMFVADMIGGA